MLYKNFLVIEKIGLSRFRHHIYFNGLWRVQRNRSESVLILIFPHFKGSFTYDVSKDRGKMGGLNNHMISKKKKVSAEFVIAYFNGLCRVQKNRSESVSVFIFPHILTKASGFPIFFLVLPFIDFRLSAILMCFWITTARKQRVCLSDNFR